MVLHKYSDIPLLLLSSYHRVLLIPKEEYFKHVLRVLLKVPRITEGLHQLLYPSDDRKHGQSDGINCDTRVQCVKTAEPRM